MLRIGLAGGVGSGKTAVAELMAADGFPVFDADRLAHEQYAPGTELAATILAEFGESLRIEGVEHLGSTDRHRGHAV